MARYKMSTKETEVYHLTNQIMIEERVGITEAAGHALAALPNPSPAFVLWLSGKTLARFGSRNLVIDELDFAHPEPGLAR